ncbi:hypothetical protein KKC13_13675 [bacterium]|nr:hypothetical protein [bacterium]MBU1957399.1 hypothetical protein [bacterium]
MAWFCKRCDAFMLFNSYYCDDCHEIREIEREAKEIAKEIKKEAKEIAKEIKKEKIRERIYTYKQQQRLEIEKKYGTVIEFEGISNYAFGLLKTEEPEEIKIISKDKTIQYKITFLKEEKNELYEALQELEDIKKYETLK